MIVGLEHSDVGVPHRQWMLRATILNTRSSLCISSRNLRPVPI